MLNFKALNPRTARTSAILAAQYSDEPHLYRIDPAALEAIEDSGCTYNFETGEVELPDPDNMPVVGSLDRATAVINWYRSQGVI